jgi:hypothetical protein
MFFSFMWAKHPVRVKNVLNLVYHDKDQIDPDLVTSILVPADDPNAGDVFFRLSDMQGPPSYVDDLLRDFSAPVLLLWGDKDPWVVPARVSERRAFFLS